MQPPSESEIYSLRLRESAVTENYPFTRSYIMAAADVTHYFKWFGVCLSVPVTATHREALSTVAVEVFCRDRGELPANTPWEISAHSRVVVPLNVRHVRFVDDWIPKRVRKASAAAQGLALRRAHPSDDTLLHTRTVRTICSHCPQQLIFMAGECTPGDEACSRNVVLPLDTFAQNKTRRPSLPLYGDRT